MSDEPTEKPKFNPLPTGRRKVNQDLTKAKILLYGPPKIGKSTLSSKFPGAWFLATEEGLDWIECQEPTMISSWDGFLDVCIWIDENKPTTFGDGTPIHTIVIDTGELLFKMCHDHMCRILGCSDLSDMGFGKGWNQLYDEFNRVMTKISRWPYGFIFVCHSKEKEIKSGAAKIDRTEPSIMATGLRVVYPLADIILYANVKEVPEMDIDGELTGRIIEERVLRCQPRNNLIAGDRTSLLPDDIPMDYDVLVKYFPETPDYSENTVEDDQAQDLEEVNEESNDYGFGKEEETPEDIEAEAKAETRNG